MRIDQLIPAYHRGDAIGDTATHMRDYFRSQGFKSRIFCLSRDDGLENESELFAHYPQPQAADVTILHYALPSPLTPAFKDLPGKKVLLYHNITPEEFFSDYSLEMTRISRLGREELKTLPDATDLALADSEYNRLELEAVGFEHSAVMPLFIDYKKYDTPHSVFLHKLFNDDRINILFVGRIVPNKKIEDLIKTVFYYKKYISPLVRLIVVGKTSSLQEYYYGLQNLADSFYLMPEELCFTGHVTDAEMFALYQAADVFLSLSEHEGFGLPFVESMIFELPIIAYNCTAVPYTLGGAGILINNKDVDKVAELVRFTAADKGFRDKIIDSQKKRLEFFRRLDLGEFITTKIKGL